MSYMNGQEMVSDQYLIQMGIAAYLVANPNKVLVTDAVTVDPADGREFFNCYLLLKAKWHGGHIHQLEDLVQAVLEDKEGSLHVGFDVSTRLFDEDHPLNECILLVVEFMERTSLDAQTISNYVEDTLTQIRPE